MKTLIENRFYLLIITFATSLAPKAVAFANPTHKELKPSHAQVQMQETRIHRLKFGVCMGLNLAKQKDYAALITPVKKQSTAYIVIRKKRIRIAYQQAFKSCVAEFKTHNPAVSTARL